jgi:hypothetical protein
MRSRNLANKLLVAVSCGTCVWGCSGSSPVTGGSGGTTSTPLSSGGTTSAGTGGASVAGSTNPSATGGAVPTSGGANGTGGAQGDGGSKPATGGAGTGGVSKGTGGAGTGGVDKGTGGAGTGGVSKGTGGAGTGGVSKGTGGTKAAGGSTVVSTGGQPTGDAGTDCVIGTWPTADPTARGPFATTQENEVGPQAGAIPDGGTQPRFTLFRPTDMAQGGLCHPVITWGNGTGATPSMYKVLLSQLASHGFVVIGSNSTNVAQGNPAPMLVGVTWVLEQNNDPTSVLYHRIDPTHVGATGHSQGAMATTQASADSRITTSVPIEGASAQRNLHGPAMFFCGGQDTLVGCNGAQSALAAVTTLPAMFAEYLSVDHGSWMSFTGTKPSTVEATVTAWMRVHLMGDPDLRSWFYGPSCKLCTDSGWVIDRKNMDQ